MEKIGVKCNYQIHFDRALIGVRYKLFYDINIIVIS